MTVPDRLVFSVITLNGASKKTNFEGNYNYIYRKLYELGPTTKVCKMKCQYQIRIGASAIGFDPEWTNERDPWGSNFRPSPFRRLPPISLTLLAPRGVSIHRRLINRIIIIILPFL